MERRCHAAVLYPPVSTAVVQQPLLITDMCQANLPYYITPLRFLLDANTYHPLH